ncbi:MAG: DUF1592 domain-containing protein [Planctomycetota bacterium]
MSFLNEQCRDCHQAGAAEGGFEVDTLLSDRDAHERWVRVFDRVDQEEMPPPEDFEIESTTRRKFLRQLKQELVREQNHQDRARGRVHGRRLTNQQLERTLQDLLRMDVPLARRMPGETRSDGFTHLASAQPMSHFQLQYHLDVVDAALDEAFERALQPEAAWSLDYGVDQIVGKRGRERNRDPEFREGLAVVWCSTMSFYGRISSTVVPDDGWYRITLEASAVRPRKGRGVWCSVRSGECVSSAPLMSWIGCFESTETPQTFQYEAWIPKGHRLEIRPSDNTLPRGRFRGGQVGVGEGEPQDIPGVGLSQLRIERIFPQGAQRKVQDRLFGSTPIKWKKRENRFVLNMADPSEAGTERWLRERIASFASLAFRRPAKPTDLEPYIEFAKATWRGSDDVIAGLRSAYRALLCSPRFLYFHEETLGDGRRLDDWSVANRLSYLLCGSMPDAELRNKAATGKLRDHETLKSEIARLLKTPRGQNFVVDFADQWLDLVDIDFTEPDRRLFGDFDPVVQQAMLAETHRFLEHLFVDNRPISELVDADYTFANERLLRYYGVDANECDCQNAPTRLASSGDGMRRVNLPDGSPRGGLFGQGAILKVTANGNDTSPVLRGIWINQRILGVTIPEPPSSVPAVEPDIRGAATIRELLQKHQADASCASCHQRIDPPGFALEAFDAGGKYRDHYRRLVGRKYEQGSAVDTSAAFRDGTEFEDYFDFRTELASRSRTVAKGVANNLITYATAEPVRFADRDVVDQIIESTMADEGGLLSLLQQVVLSDLFLQK